jgi:hypothetical protein
LDIFDISPRGNAVADQRNPTTNPSLAVLRDKAVELGLDPGTIDGFVGMDRDTLIIQAALWRDQAMKHQNRSLDVESRSGTVILSLFDLCRTEGIEVPESIYNAANAIPEKPAAANSAPEDRLMYLVEGRRKDGRPAWIGSEDGYGTFVEKAWGASMTTSPSSAKATLASVPKMHGYYNADRMDLSSFKIHETRLEMKPVAEITAEIRAKLAVSDAQAPAGWRFLVIDAEGREFAAPERHWKGTTGSLSEAVATPSFAGAVEALDRVKQAGWRIVLAYPHVDPQPLPNDILFTRVAAEKSAKAAVDADEDLSGIDVYQPKF